MRTQERFLSGVVGVVLWVVMTPTWAASQSGIGSNNVVVVGDLAYATGGMAGLLVYDLETTTLVNQIASPAGSRSVDDVAFADGFLFVLDGLSPGVLSVLSLVDPLHPSLLSSPVEVDVGPFAGVSAAAGMVSVSGGTGQVSVLAYDTDGNLGTDVANIDLGIGQPDILLDPDGGFAYVSTDFSGTVDGQPFGISVIALNTPPQAPVLLTQIGIPGAGFTPGVQGPANFPIESAVWGDTLFVAHGSGVAILDITTPATTQLLQMLPLSLSAVNVDARDDALYVVGSSPTPTLAIVDVSDIWTPQVVDRIDLPAGSMPTGVAAGAAHIAVADTISGVLIFPRK